MDDLHQGLLFLVASLRQRGPKKVISTDRRQCLKRAIIPPLLAIHSRTGMIGNGGNESFKRLARF